MDINKSYNNESEMKCPQCGGPMMKSGNMWKCQNCGHEMPAEDNQ